jgi:hypothetical protein
MAVLNREDFFSRLQNAIGTDTSDESISLIEDMTDTYNDLETRANGDGENWEKKYHDLDEAWKQKYRHRFFSNNGRSNMPNNEPNEPNNGETITVEDLFK